MTWKAGVDVLSFGATKNGCLATEAVVFFKPELAFPTQSNEVFAHLPQKVIDNLNRAGFKVTEGELDETAPPRFVTVWNTDAGAASTEASSTVPCQTQTGLHRCGNKLASYLHNRIGWRSSLNASRSLR